MTARLENIVSGASLVASAEVALDGRRPIQLDHHGHVLEIVAGHADIFAVDVDDMNLRADRKILGVSRALTIVETASEHDYRIGILEDEVRSAIAINTDLPDIAVMVMRESR